MVDAMSPRFFFIKVILVDIHVCFVDDTNWVGKPPFQQNTFMYFEHYRNLGWGPYQEKWFNLPILVSYSFWTTDYSKAILRPCGFEVFPSRSPCPQPLYFYNDFSSIVLLCIFLVISDMNSAIVIILLGIRKKTVLFLAWLLGIS